MTFLTLNRQSVTPLLWHFRHPSFEVVLNVTIARPNKPTTDVVLAFSFTGERGEIIKIEWKRVEKVEIETKNGRLQAGGIIWRHSLTGCAQNSRARFSVEFNSLNHSA